MNGGKIVEVKICGLTSAEDANAALDFGADYIGFVLFPRSPRAVNAVRLAQILDRVKNRKKAVAVFVNEARRRVEQVARDCGLRAIQLHGDEDPRDFEDMPLPVWRAVSVIENDPEPNPDEWTVERYMFDSPSVGRYGGTGIQADWEEAAAFAKRRPTMLAGGLNPENVAQAIAKVRPLGVDVSSGVEKSPGVKDLKKLEEFIKNARRALEPAKGK